MARARSDASPSGGDIAEVERPDESVPVVGNESSKAELKQELTFKEDADLHPAGEPKSGSEKEPGGPPAKDPNRPPFATNRPDEPIITSLATGAGEHTPPDPDTVETDGFVRPLKAEENE